MQRGASSSEAMSQDRRSQAQMTNGSGVGTGSGDGASALANSQHGGDGTSTVGGQDAYNRNGGADGGQLGLSREDSMLNGGGRNGGGAVRDDLIERISPDELIGDKREEYLNKLWDLFQLKSEAGFLPFDQVEEFSVKLGVEGATTDSLQRSITDEVQKTIEERGGMTFEDVVDLFDAVSRQANEAYRDVELNKGSVTEKVYVGPLDYIWFNYLCGTRATTDDGTEVLYRLDHSYSVELTPKRTLLLTTSLLMVLIGVMLMVLISMLWFTNSRDAETNRITDLRKTIDRLASNYETYFFYEHEDELLDQTAVIGDLVDNLYNLEIDEHKRRQRRWAAAVDQFSHNMLDQTTSQNIDKMSVLEQLIRHGAEVKDSALADVIPEASARVLKGNGSDPNLLYASGYQNCLRPSSGVVDEDFGTFFYNLYSVVNSTMSPYCVSISQSTHSKWASDAVNKAIHFVDGLNGLRGLNVTFSLLNVEHDSRLPNTTAPQSDNAGRYLQGLPDGFDPDSEWSVDSNILTAEAKASCQNDDKEILCPGLLQAAASLPVVNEDGEEEVMESEEYYEYSSRLRWSFPDLLGLGNLSTMASFSKIRTPNMLQDAGGVNSLVSVVSASTPLFLMNAQDRLIDAVQYLNWQFVRTTEVVLGRENSVTKAFETQVTSFRFDGCWNYDICFRLPPSTTNAVASYKFKGQSKGITPDYRPEPVDGASQWLPRLEAVLLLERDVQEVRGLCTQSLIDIVDSLNPSLSGTTEIELFHQQDHPFMKVFDPYTPCEEGVDCIELPAPIGVYYRYDCAHCQRQVPLPDDQPIAFLTKRKKPIDTDQTSTTDLIYRQTVLTRTHQSGDFLDYNGDDVRGETGFIANLSMGIMVKIDRSELLGSTEQKIYIAVAVGIAALVFGLVVQMVLSSKALGAIENNWIQSKAKIEADRERFGELVGDIIPPTLAEKMMKGATMISDAHNASCVMFADISNFSEWTKGFTPRQVIRLTGYCFVVLETVAEHCKLRRLTSVGDTFVTYALQDSSSRKDVIEHPAVRGAKYAVLAAQLFSPRFAHFPERAKFFRDAFKERFRSQTPFELPQLRFGGHCSTMISCIIDTGRAPRFDCYGMAPSLAARMVATALPGSTHVTSVMKDIITNCCSKAEQDNGPIGPGGRPYSRLFLFEEPRKTIVRGIGTITSYLVASTIYEVSTGLSTKLGIQRAKTLFDFNHTVATEGGSMNQSFTSVSTGKSSGSGKKSGGEMESSKNSGKMGSGTKTSNDSAKKKSTPNRPTTQPTRKLF